MRVALIGMGKMGHRIAALAPESGIEIAQTFDRDFTIAQLEEVDAVIEFTEPASAPANLLALASKGVPTVCGTTGWYEGQLPEVKTAFASGSLVYGPNFSIGVAVFAQVLAEATRRLKDFEDFGVFAHESHHTAKKDRPSGTLRLLVDQMKEAGWTREIDESTSRAGHIPGTHQFVFDAPDETITLEHRARSRDAFARGALFAARWISTRKGVYEFKEIMNHV